jgi:hypothetical protein
MGDSVGSSINNLPLLTCTLSTSKEEQTGSTKQTKQGRGSSYPARIRVIAGAVAELEARRTTKRELDGKAASSV